MIELKCQIQFSQKFIFLMYFYTWLWVEKKVPKGFELCGLEAEIWTFKDLDFDPVL